MTRRWTLMVACLLPLAACDNSPQVSATNATAEEVAEKVADAGGSGQFIRPGKWQTRVTVEDIAIPGMPAAMQAQMKSAFAQRQNIAINQCVTKEDAERPDGKFFTGKDSGNCRYDHFTMKGGKVDALMRCEGEPSGSMTMKMAGTYTADTSTTRSEMVVSGGQEGSMTIKAVTEARRVGDCDGTEGA